MSNLLYNPNNDKVVGFKKEAEEITDRLIRGPKERDVMLISGMGGLGKTTLVKRVYGEERVVKHFDIRAWCTVSQDYDSKDLLNEIYSQVHGSGGNVAEKLFESLLGKRYLIVLDDIWSREAWEEVNTLFPSCDNGSRIVLTSRRKDLVSDAKHFCLPVGFKTEAEAEAVLDQLILGAKERDVVLISGMDGLGKTTLVKRVYGEERVVKHFDIRAWCTVSQGYDFENVLNKIYSQVSNDNVAEELRKSLMGKRYLVVLDDIWSLEPWERLNSVFPSCDDCGSRIVLTSRQENVVSDDAKNICLPFFTDDESWELLQVKLFKGEKCPEELESIGRKISEKCGGLPLVVILVAALLGVVQKKEQMWHEFLNTLISTGAFRAGRVEINEVIELSYNHLLDHLKPCFLYFSVFPEDAIIDVSYLMKLWIAEGYVETEDPTERTEDKAEDYLNHMVSSNLIIVSGRKYDGRVLRCMVHDLVRDFCLIKAKDEKFLEEVNLEYPSMKFSPHSICFHRYPGREVPFESVPQNSSIRALFGFKNGSKTNSRIYDGSWISKNLEFLTILDLEFICVHVSILSRVNNSLIHLRYLALVLDGGGSVSPLSLENLGFLITLRLMISVNANFLHLPKFFYNMRGLRHLHTIHRSHCCSRMKASESVIEGTLNLESLQTFHSNCSLDTRDEHLLRKLPHLKKLSCAVSGSYPFPDINCLGNLESLELVNLGGGTCFVGDLKLDEFPSSIKEIRLVGFTVQSSAIPVIADLPNLEALILHHCKFEESEWNVEEETKFRKLKYLELSFSNLEMWNIESCDSFSCLEKLILENCEELHEVPSGLADILTLKVIIVDGCRSSLHSSAKEILQYASDMGNEHLKVEINSLRMNYLSAVPRFIRSSIPLYDLCLV